jgi:L-ascorbate metabolism protein UlaG (beta-lactamase superfamily)
MLKHQENFLFMSGLVSITKDSGTSLGIPIAGSSGTSPEHYSVYSDPKSVSLAPEASHIRILETVAKIGSLRRIHVGQGSDGSPTLKRNGLFHRNIDRKDVLPLIGRSVTALNATDAKSFRTVAGYTEEFFTVQRYNQVASNLSLPKVKIQGFPELDPVVLGSQPPHSVCTNRALQVVEREGRFYYDEQDSQISHPGEASRIFCSTQIERFLSLFAKILSCCKKYCYFRNEGEPVYRNDNPLPADPAQPSSYWIGHATCLIHIPFQRNGQSCPINILTDPVEGDIAPIIYPRMTRPARPIEECPPVHVLLISHNHRDHFKPETIKKLLPQQPIIIVSRGDGKELRAMGFTNVREVNWWEQVQIQTPAGFDFTITATPSHHWSNQGIFDVNRSAFVGYVIHGPGISDVYFAGDTARLSNPLIDEMYRLFDICTIFQPGGPDDERRDMQSTHQCSADGLVVFCQLVLKKYISHQQKPNPSFSGEMLFIPPREGFERQLKLIYMHNKTYKLGCLHFDDTERSIDRVLNALENKEIPPEGEEISWEGFDLKPYEIDVCRELVTFLGELSTKYNYPFSKEWLVNLLRKVTVDPQIGQRTNLYEPLPLQ